LLQKTAILIALTFPKNHDFDIDNRHITTSPTLPGGKDIKLKPALVAVYSMSILLMDSAYLTVPGLHEAEHHDKVRGSRTGS